MTDWWKLRFTLSNLGFWGGHVDTISCDDALPPPTRLLAYSTPSDLAACTMPVMQNVVFSVFRDPDSLGGLFAFSESVDGRCGLFTFWRSESVECGLFARGGAVELTLPAARLPAYPRGVSIADCIQ